MSDLLKIGVCCLVTGAVAAGAGWYARGMQRPAVVAANLNTVKPGETAAGGDGEVESLRRENAELRAQLDQLRQGQKDAENEAENESLRVALQQSLRSLTEGEPADRKPEEAWRRGYASMERQAKQGMFGDIEQQLKLIMDMANKGPAGITTLTSIVADGARSMKERETALNVLSHIRDRKALAAILTLREPDVMELDYPYDLIELQLSALPTSQVQEFAPQIVQQIGMELATDDMTPERTEVLALLALSHRNQQAQQLLMDPRVLKENAGGAVEIADQVHTPQARQFVEWLANNHARPSVQQAAREILGQW